MEMVMKTGLAVIAGDDVIVSACFIILIGSG